MKKLVLTLVCLLVTAFAATVSAQKKAAAYKLTNIKIVPFEKRTGQFENEIIDKDTRTFFNEISKNYLVTVEVAGETGSYETGRQIEIVVYEGKILKSRKLQQMDLIGDGGKVFMPLWIDTPLCNRTVISARIIGQKTPSALKRPLTVFQCGE